MFLAAVFIIAKTWKQLKCPSAGAWINKLDTPTDKLFSALKTNELLRRHEEN